ncbi:translation initiation factor IF-2 subunit beta [Candidatus Woesearchaeota archaeon]|nr:translation initiation factor IF-2 subunit beta [Candidatus Woesearchaeota archaeon]
MKKSDDYESMLSEGLEQLPASVKTKSRFEMPKVTGHVEGNKTIVSNFFQIAKALNVDSKHLMKYLQRELAAPSVIDGQRVVFTRKLSSSMINQKLQDYADLFVLCHVCKKPDTKIESENGVQFLICTACGAKSPIKAKI